MIPSPKVATYDKDPKMSVKGVAEKVAEVVRQKEHEFVMCNFAPPDMVGHTGVYDAAVEAIGHTDEAVGIVYKACEEAGYILLITADHGNAEQMINLETGAPHTAHTTNPVPFIMTGDPKKLSFAADKKDDDEEEGALADVAPTILDVMVSASMFVACVHLLMTRLHAQGLPKPEGKWSARYSVCAYTDMWPCRNDGTLPP